MISLVDIGSAQPSSDRAAADARSESRCPHTIRLGERRQRICRGDHLRRGRLSRRGNRDRRVLSGRRREFRSSQARRIDHRCRSGATSTPQRDNRDSAPPFRSNAQETTPRGKVATDDEQAGNDRSHHGGEVQERHDLGGHRPGRSACPKIFVTSVCLGQNSFTAEQAAKLTGFLDFGNTKQRRRDCAAAAAAEGAGPRHRREGSADLPVLRNRLCLRRHHQGDHPREIRRRHHERDRLRSCRSTRSNIPKGDRVKVTMSGKFLPYNRW